MTITASLITILLPFLAMHLIRNRDDKDKLVHYFLIGSSLLLLAGRIWLIFYVAIVTKTWVTFMLGDLCTFISPVILILLAMKRYDLAKVTAPWAIIGGSITLFTLGDLSDPFHLEGFISHSALYFVSFALLVIDGQWTKTDVKRSIMFIGMFILYILLVPGTIYWSTGNPYWGALSTALLRPSYEVVDMGYGITSSEYGFLSKLPMPYPVPTIIFYALAVGMALGIIKATNWYHEGKGPKELVGALK